MMTMQTPTKNNLNISSRITNRLDRGELTTKQVKEFQSFLAEVERDLLHHRIITNNRYTQWFSLGQATDVQLRHFIRQFSVFSNQFLIAALLKTINSPTLEQSRSSREILLNELGVIYRNPQQSISGRSMLTESEKDREGDPELVSTEGTVDGGICRFQAAHFEWLLQVAIGLGFSFADIGKRRHGTLTTLHFCDELIRLYGSDDSQIAQGASFAVENWAAAGFWQELEDGLFRIKQTRHPQLLLAFFTWHNRVEAQHAGHTLEELETAYFQANFNRTKFFQGGRLILNAIAVFWDGLYKDLQQQLSR
ncbi:hypothetical protein Xen7305DRAFT_00030090 [Xenococcus sp. PCC 7305]|uniref:hypothetical protein n=1 Tax=Xenococcus sp. PCC 7305 TaxID=102125 RepID=UPI0002ACAF2A|nr:hypothetical protein [Xenococcus sp. PCC 7305]ELS03288.1 hypothetical protein Xen7305DRAFT_00030090 [Xenococcus sp. PCC 7305]